MNDGSGVTPGTEIHWKIDTTVNAGDTLDIIYLRHPGYIQDFIGFTETITVVPNGSPLITSQPASLEAEPGGTATFTLSATGNPPLSYQWFKNGSLLAGANGSSLEFHNAQVTDSASYHVVVGNSSGL